MKMPIVPASAVDAFLSALLRVEFGGSPPDPGPPPCPDWEAAAQRALALGIAPLIHAIVEARPGIAAPEGPARRLAGSYAKAWAANARTLARLGELLAAFEREGIRVILLKGAHLAFLAYRDIGMRPMVDVDILLREDDLPAAERLLAGSGYAPRAHVPQAYDFLGDDAPSLDAAPLSARYRERHHHLHPLGSARGLRLLDVHRSIVSPSLPFSIDAAGLWRRAETRLLEGRKAEVLCPEDAVLCAALHASASNRFRASGLKSLCDIAALAAGRRAPDWSALCARTREWNAGRFVYSALLLAADICGAQIPTAALDSMRPADFSTAVAEEAVRRLLPAPARGLPARLVPPFLIRCTRGLRRRLRRGASPPPLLDSWLTAGTPGRGAAPKGPGNP